MSLAADIQKVKNELGVAELTVVADSKHVANQTALGGSVSFAEALRSAIQSFLENGDSIESPVGLVQNDPGAYDLPDDADIAAITEFLRQRMNQPSSQVILLDAEYRFLPEEGETVDENWIFRLEMPDTFSGLTWAIVPRSGSEPAYNYNFDWAPASPRGESPCRTPAHAPASPQTLAAVGFFQFASKCLTICRLLCYTACTGKTKEKSRLAKPAAILEAPQKPFKLLRGWPITAIVSQRLGKPI